MMKMLAPLFALLCLSLPVAHAAEAEQATEYVVTRGDTLWGLSERFFKDPHYWPNLWAKNPSVMNPHIIFPGQKLKFYKDRVETVPDTSPPAPVVAENAPDSGELSTAVPTEKVIQEKVFSVAAGETFLEGDTLQKAGKIIGTFENRVMVGEGDYVYTDIGSTQGGKVGQVYSVFVKGDDIRHPTERRFLGNRYQQLGTIKLVEVDSLSSKAAIIRSYLEMGRNGILVPYRSAKREIPLKKSSRDLSGRIVATRKSNQLVGEGETIYLDLGTRQGLEVGNLLYCVREVTVDAPNIFSEKTPPLPLQVQGAAVVVETGSNTATALVIKSAGPMFPGDLVVTSPAK